MNATLSSALGAIESNDRETALREYVDIIHAGASDDPAVRERATQPETVLKLRSIMASLGKSRADVARDEGLIARFQQDKDACRSCVEVVRELGKAERAAEEAHADYEREIAEAMARRNAVWALRDNAVNLANAARAAQLRCKELMRNSPELFRPNDREYLMLYEHGQDGGLKFLYQQTKAATAAK